MSLQICRHLYHSRRVTKLIFPTVEQVRSACFSDCITRSCGDLLKVILQDSLRDTSGESTEVLKCFIATLGNKIVVTVQ